MNSKVIFIGIIIISVVFLGGFYFFLNQRQQQIINNLPTPPSQAELIQLTNQQEIEKANQIAVDESYSLEFLLRGEVLNFSNNQLSVLAQIINADGSSTEKLVTVTPPTDNQILCWPETMGSGTNQVSLRNAYFQIEPGQILYMNDQTQKAFSALSTSDIEGGYIFALVTESLRTESNDQFQANQLALLGC